jgi:hypothetical protein
MVVEGGWPACYAAMWGNHRTEYQKVTGCAIRKVRLTSSMHAAIVRS